MWKGPDVCRHRRHLSPPSTRRRSKREQSQNGRRHTASPDFFPGTSKEIHHEANRQSRPVAPQNLPNKTGHPRALAAATFRRVERRSELRNAPRWD